MTTLRSFLSRYRFTLLALLVSFALHAALIAGLPGRFGAVDEPASAIFSATLDAVTLVDGESAGTNPAPATPKRVASKPRPKPRVATPPKPEEFVASAPQPVEAPSPEPELPPEPDLPPPPENKPEVLALAPVTTLAPAVETPEPFPVRALPDRLKVTYALNSAFADGKATYEWERDGDNYTITGEAQAEGFFTLFLEGRVLQESRGKITPDGLRPDRFSESMPRSPPEGLEFDWNARKVTFDRNGEKIVSELSDNTVDWLSMIFQLAHRPPRGEAFDLRVFTQRRMYTFRLRVLGEEEIELPIGKVRALHLRHVDEEKNGQVDVWLGVDQHYVPVKMRYPVSRNRFMVEQIAIRISGP